MNLGIKIYFLTFFTLGCQLAFSQKTETYDGLFKLNDNTYEADFEFYTENGDTLYHGPFSLTKQIEESSEKHDFYFSAIEGKFHQHKADGPWTLRKGYFTPSGKGVFKDYNYSFKINGSEFIAKGELDKGAKNSPWEIYEWEIKDSKIQDTLFSAHFPYKNNRIAGDFHLSHHNEHLEGSVDNQQFTSNNWSFYIFDDEGEKVMLKEWEFENNRLVRKVLYENGEREVLDITQPPSDDMILEEVPLDLHYLKIIDLKASVKDAPLYEKYTEKEHIRELFFDVMERAKVIDSIFKPIARAQISPRIKTKIAKFPYSESEAALLDTVKENTSAADSLMVSVTENPQINLASLSNEKVSFYLAVLNSIDELFLERNKEVTQHYNDGTLEYLNRDLFIKNKTSRQEQVQVTYIFNEDTLQGNYQFNNINTNNDSAPLEQLKTLSEDIIKEINSLSDSINPYIQEIKQEKKLSEIEAALFSKYEQVKHLTDSLITEEHDQLAGFNVSHELNNFAQRVLKDYSSLDKTQEKIQQVEPTLDCLNKLENLVKTLEAVPENKYMVRDAYTRQVFNPYIMRDMEEKVKQPIYNSFTKVILPGIFANLKDMECDNVKPYSNNFNIIFEGMIDILKRNTRREERKIKRTKDASRAAEILGLNLEF
ncbi:hypothetical protein RCC89_18265 [Cytophagaceae bacterium ABcell3]|nr:hypothetical protein RCC89_18265 [Cytophagaceae bacterium ABcell3]